MLFYTLAHLSTLDNILFLHFSYTLLYTLLYFSRFSYLLYFFPTFFLHFCVLFQPLFCTLTNTYLVYYILLQNSPHYMTSYTFSSPLMNCLTNSSKISSNLPTTSKTFPHLSWMSHTLKNRTPVQVCFYVSPFLSWSALLLHWSFGLLVSICYLVCFSF